jgi:hypothetical protein
MLIDFFCFLLFECTKGSEDTVFHHKGTVARSFTETFLMEYTEDTKGRVYWFKGHGGYNDTIE